VFSNDVVKLLSITGGKTKHKRGVIVCDRIIVRAMTESDLDQAIDLWRTAFNAGFSARFDTKPGLVRYLHRNPDLSSVACTEDGKVIGALLCGHDGRRGSIYNVAVAHGFRRQGIGQRMEQRSLAELKKVGINSGFLFVNESNPGSREFWSSIGWSVIPEVKYLYKEF